MEPQGWFCQLFHIVLYRRTILIFYKRLIQIIFVNDNNEWNDGVTEMVLSVVPHHNHGQTTLIFYNRLIHIVILAMLK